MPTVFYAQIISGLLYRNTKNVFFFRIRILLLFELSKCIFIFPTQIFVDGFMCKQVIYFARIFLGAWIYARPTLIFWAKSQSFCNNNQHHLYVCTASFFSALKLLKIIVFALKILSDLGHCIFFDVCILSADILCNYEYIILCTKWFLSVALPVSWFNFRFWEKAFDFIDHIVAHQIDQVTVNDLSF